MGCLLFHCLVDLILNFLSKKKCIVEPMSSHITIEDEENAKWRCIFFFEWFCRLLLVSLYGCYCHLNFLLEDYTFIHIYIYICMYVYVYICVCVCVCVYQLISKMLFSIRVSSILFILKMYNRSEYIIVVKHDHLKKWYLNKIE